MHVAAPLASMLIGGLQDLRRGAILSTSAPRGFGGEMAKLAMQGAASVRRGRPWTPWPAYDAASEAAVVGALRDRRWTVSWPSAGKPSVERRFAEQFARYTGAAWAVAVDHGSGALVVALEALDIGPGDEVIVPVLTWVACASAVLRVGALPVLVDIDVNTGCISPQAWPRPSHRARGRCSLCTWVRASPTWPGCWTSPPGTASP
jgi:DegT/DnrJ/EryC1/StrS aminotransferase family